MHGMVGWQGQERMGGGGKSWVPDLHAKAECVTREAEKGHVSQEVKAVLVFPV